MLKIQNIKNYKQKRTLKMILLIFALSIGIGTILFTTTITSKLEKEESKKAQTWANTIEELSKGNMSPFILKSLKSNKTVPSILTDDEGNILDHINLDTNKLKKNPHYLQTEYQKMKNENIPIEITLLDGSKQFVYYNDSYLLKQLKYYPIIQLGIIILFLFISYLAFSASRKHEQNRVWVGLAKETAHQLGTPISSLIAWVEILRLSDKEDVKMTATEINKDIDRLQKITDRFSKIGSMPLTEEKTVFYEVKKSITYLEKRISKNVPIVINEKSEKHTKAMMISVLIDWVIENICKNAVNAMNGKGKIEIMIASDRKNVNIDITDTGKGIERSKFKTVFKPGFSTRKRGWGLGLSLAKRIVEEYHKGKIFVKWSEVGVGSTFRIKLRKK